MPTRRPMPPFAALLALTLLTVLLALMPAAARGAASPEDELAAQVAAGRLDPAVYDAVVNTGSAQGMVIFDDASIQATAAALRASFGLPFDNEFISGFVRSSLSARKADAVGSAGPGVAVLRDYDSFGIQFAGFDSAASLAALLRSPLVAGVTANHVYTATLAQSLPLINQPAAAALGKTGAGKSVAIIDTGVEYGNTAFGACSVPGGSCKVAYAQDFAPNDGARDENGHGTNVAGIALGVAPGAKILALDVFDGNGASDSDILDALNWVYNNRATYNIASVNMSLGGSATYSSQCSTFTEISFTPPYIFTYANPYVGPIANLRNAGILTAIASGNGGSTGGLSAPACTPGAISVGAVYDANMGTLKWSSCTDSTTAADKVTCFSNSASYLSLLAPGSQITGPYKLGTATLSGTSMAAPHVAGALAVLRSAAPGATAAQLETALTTTGPNVTDTRNTITKHRLDVCAALTAVGVSCTGSTPPSSTCYSLTTGVTPPGSGSVGRSPANSSGCPTGQYTLNAAVQLTATAGSGNTFANWSGDASGTGNPVNVTMSANKSVTANFNVPTSSCGAGVTSLANGVALGSQSVGVGAWKYYCVTVPSGTTNLAVTTTGGSGNADLYLRFDSKPTSSVYGCRSRSSGNAESCSQSNPTAGTWYIGLYGSSSASGITITASMTSSPGGCYTLTKTVNPSGSGTISASPANSLGCPAGQYTVNAVVQLTATPASGNTFANWSGAASGTTNPVNVTMSASKSVTANFNVPAGICGSGVTTLTSGAAVASQSVALNGWKYYCIVVPSGATQLSVTTSGGTGDADLYVRNGSKPTLSIYQCGSWLAGTNNETCTLPNPAAGTWYIGVYGYKAASGFTLTATAGP